MKSKPTQIKAKKRRMPRQDRALQLREDIVTAGFKTLEKFGLSKFSTNKVAEIAGVSIGSIYQYFSSKDEIIELMIANVGKDILKAALSEMSSLNGLSFDDFAEQLSTTLFSMFLKRKSILALLFIVRTNDSSLRTVMENRQVFLNQLLEYINTYYPATNEQIKNDREGMVKVLVHSFMGLVQSLLYYQVTPQEWGRHATSFVRMAKVSMSSLNVN